MAGSAPHTLKVFDEELEELRALVAELSGRAEMALNEAMLAFVRLDSGGAAEVIAADARIDAMAAEVERRGVLMLALRAPMADDLREVLAAIKVAAAIERIGDYARNIARRVPQIRDTRGIDPAVILPAMGAAAAAALNAALDAFVTRDAEAAARVCEDDRIIDDYYDSLFRALLTCMIEQPYTITTCTHLLFIAQYLERIGDHAANVARIVYFSATGEALAEPVEAAAEAELEPR